MKVINLFGGPGVGKSTLAAGIFFNLKLKRVNVALSSEWIKDKVYEGSPYPFKDQLYTFAKQNKTIRQLRNKVDVVVCDSPILQCLVYVTEEPEIFTQTVLTYFNQYDNINILLKRDAEYESYGRNQTVEEADKVAIQVENLLKKLNISYIEMPTRKALENIEDILKMI